MHERNWGVVAWAVCLTALCAGAQDPDGVVIAGPDVRYLTRKPGFWQSQTYRGSHGAGAAPAEAQAIGRNLKNIQAVLMATPTGANPVGFYFMPSPMWTSSARKDEPIEQGLSIFPLHFVEFRQAGVWKLDMNGETESVSYNINQLGQIERASPAILEEPGPNGETHPMFAPPLPVGVLGGFPVYGDTLYIARPGRALWKAVTVVRAMKAAMRRYALDRDGAEHRLAASKQRARELSTGEYEQHELEKFEKEWGSLRNTNPGDYEERKRMWMAPVLRQRDEALNAANAPRGDRKSDWYWNPLDAFAEAQRRLAGLTAEEGAAPACFEKAVNGEGRYAMPGEVRGWAAGAACQALVETNPDYYDRALPRTAVQLITVTSISRCATFRGSTLISSSTRLYSGGCPVHARMWQELNWQNLAELLVK